MLTEHPPLSVRDLNELAATGPTPAEVWLTRARRNDLVLPLAAAAVMLAVAVAVAVFAIVAPVLS